MTINSKTRSDPLDSLVVLQTDELRDLYAEDEKVVGKLIRSVIEQNPDFLERLKVCVENSDHYGIAEIAHEWRGVLANLFAARLVARLGKLEKSARFPEFRLDAEALEQLVADSETLGKELTNFLDQMKGTP